MRFEELKRRPLLIAFLIGLGPFLMESIGCSFDATGTRILTFEADPNAYMCNCTCSAPLSANEPVALAGDDGRERVSNGNVNTTQDSVQLSSDRLVGLRFAGVAVPTGVTIDSAFLQMTSGRTDSIPLTLSVAAELVADAAPIAELDGNLSGRPLTAASVAWPVAPWVAGESGLPQRSPDLGAVIQEIVNTPGWADGNAIILLLSHVAGDGERRLVSVEGDPDAAARLEIVYTDPLTQAQVELSVCMPAELNPNIPTTDPEPSIAALVADCESRVQANVSGMASMCGYAEGCTCTVEPVADPDPMRFVDASCDEECVGEDLAPDCSNFDPESGNKSATNVPGEEPICLVASADPPTPIPDALAGGLFGRRSRCETVGSAEVLASGVDPRTPQARSTLFIMGDPCPNSTCEVGLAYRAEVDPFSYDGGFLGAGDTTISEVQVSGATLPFAVTLDPSGAGLFAEEETFSTGRGRRRTNRVIRSDIDKRESFIGTNGLPVDVDVDWVNKRCTFRGTLLGGEPILDDDPDEDEEPTENELTVSVDLQGNIVNQPPFAVADSNSPVECTSPSGAPVVLFGNDSFDADDNILFARWTEGSRTGTPVGFGRVARTSQALGEIKVYSLTVVDALGEASTTSTQVTVQDTTPPLLAPPADVTAECVAPEGTPVPLGTPPLVADACDLAPVVTNDAPDLFPVGTTVVTWTATDASSNSFEVTQVVEVQDTTPPEITLSVDPSSIWPPNHKMETITATVEATDVCDPNPAVELVSVVSNEPDDGIGDGATSDDVQGADVGTDDRSFEVRVERQGTEDGRVYTATYQAVDQSGNTTPTDATICVSHDQGNGQGCAPPGVSSAASASACGLGMELVGLALLRSAYRRRRRS